jgi:predicted extracellular nuclease
MSWKTSIFIAKSNPFAIFLMALLLGVPGMSRADIVAFDMVGSASQNLVSFTDDPAIPFGSAGDGFNKFQRGVSSSIPFAVADDSAGSFPPDTLGIIKTGDTDEFFGIVDTNNPDTSGRDVVATWVFDISGASDLALSIDMGAMGDFEASPTTGDFFNWSYSIDGGAAMTAFQSSVDEDATQTYTMEGGALVSLDDPMLLNGVLLTNNLVPFVAPLTGTGSQLTLILTANTDSGSEAIAFQNLVIRADGTPPPFADLMINEIMQNPSAVSDSNGEWFEVHNTTDTGIDIDGWTILDNDFDLHLINNGGPLLVPAGGYLVLGNNADFATNGGVNVDYQYSGVFLSNSSDELVLLDVGGAEIDRVEWDNGATFPDPIGASMSLKDSALDNNIGANWCESVTPFGNGDLGTPGNENSCVLVIPPFGQCGDEAVFIHQVQGSGLSSPWAGTPGVIIEGVVVGDFQGSDELRGFFLQEEDADADADPQTSEGIFVFDNGFGPDVAEGDVVRVQGTVEEFFDLTRLSSIADMADCNTTDIASASAINLPRSSVDDWETTEGMAIEFPQTLFVSGNFTQARYGEIDLAVDAPLDNPTNVVEPGVAANALQALNDVSRIQLDDGSTVQNPLPLPPYLDVDNTRRVGDSVSSLTGVLGYAFGVYEVHPTSAVNFVRENERPLGPPDVGGSLVTVAGFNVLNYFTTLDGSGPICGPNADQGCRGADSVEEFDRQKAKLVSAITTLDADIVGLTELENAADNTPIADLVDGLNNVVGTGTYDYIATGAIGSDAIRQGFIYKPSNVMPVGGFAILDNTVDPDFNDDRNRPVLAQTFQENTSGERITVAVNHLKSKGSPCDAIGDPDTGDGQGNCNVTRTDAAQALVDWLATDPTASGDSDFLIVGDLNAYAMEDPVMVIEAGGYIDLIKTFVGTGYTDGAYSFSFFGQAGYLDHALSSPDLLTEVSGAASWHINADEPSGLDYNSYNQPGLFNPDEFRASDHDAIVVGLLLDEDEDGVWDGVDRCPATVIPESVPTDELKANRFALVDGDGIFDTTTPNGNGPEVSFDIFDTLGCSCEQIIEAQGLGKGQQKYGCSQSVMKAWVEFVNSP